MPKPFPRAVLWDMDGTLIDSEPIHAEALVRNLETHAISPPPDFHDALLGRDAPEVFAMLSNAFDLTVTFESWILGKYQHYFSLLPRLRPRKGALDVYRVLEERNIPQAVASNSDRLILNANLRALEIEKPGLRSVSRNDVITGKPDPEAYQRAALLLNVTPRDAIVVEDSITGASAGVAAQCRTLFWPQVELPTPEGAERIHSAQDLAERLGVVGTLT